MTTLRVHPAGEVRRSGAGAPGAGARYQGPVHLGGISRVGLAREGAGVASVLFIVLPPPPAAATEALRLGVEPVGVAAAAAVDELAASAEERRVNLVIL